MNEQLLEPEPLQHMRLRPDCGACGYSIHYNEQILTLLDNKQSGTPEVCGPYRFPEYGYDSFNQSPPGWLLCRFPSCDKCTLGPECTTVHVDCFNLFIRQCESPERLELLWTAATWRYPWKNVPPIQLEPSVDVDRGRGIQLASEICELPRLVDMPFEIAELIRGFSPPSTLWRFASVLDLVDRLASHQLEDTISVPLSEIGVWERGSVPVTDHGSDEDVVRLTIDARGLRKVEKLDVVPPPTGLRSESFAYVVETADQFKDVTANFKLGFGHLTVPNDASDIRLWDRPCPPPLLDSLIYHTPVARRSLRLNSINLQSSTGLTFFMTSRDTYAIHAHTRTKPTAHATFNKLPSRQQEVAAWVYVPLPSCDRVEGFGVRRSLTDGGQLLNNPCYLFRTALAGDFSVGSDEKRRSRSIFVNTGPGLSLVHNISEGKPLSLIGAYPQVKDQPSEWDSVPHSPIAMPRIGRGCFSYADLSNVESMSVYEDEKSRFCKGVIFEYENGAQRAIGQCRVGEDPVVTFRCPSKIYIAPVGDRRLNSKWGLGEAMVTGEEPPASDGQLWAGYEMRGELQFWFDRNVSQLLIV